MTTEEPTPNEPTPPTHDNPHPNRPDEDEETFGDKDPDDAFDADD